MSGPIHPYFCTPFFEEDDEFTCHSCGKVVLRDDVDWDTWEDQYDGAPDAVNVYNCLDCRKDD